MKQNIERGRPPATNKGMELVHQAQQNYQQQHSFKPQINKSIGRAISKEERWDNLVKPKTEKLLQRDMQKAQKEIEEIKKHCTFKPSLATNKDTMSTGRL